MSLKSEAIAQKAKSRKAVKYSRECEVCGKKPQSGHLVSHSNIKTNRAFNPNLQNVRHQKPNGEVVTLCVCTRCIRSGAVTKPAVRNV